MRKSILLPAFGGLILLACNFIPPTYADNFDNRAATQMGRAGNRHAKKKLSAAAEARADNKAYRVQGQDFRMRTRNHGQLTRRDRRKLNNELNGNQNRMNNATH